MRKQDGRSGQAMIELLLGLIGILVLLLGIELIANIVHYDFTTIYSAREEVADNLMDKSAGTSGGSSLYDFNEVDGDFEDALNPSGQLKSWYDESYTPERETQFDFLWVGSDPLQDLVGSARSSSTPVTSELMRRITGRGTISLDNAIYMPPWEDLLYPDGGGGE